MWRCTLVIVVVAAGCGSHSAAPSPKPHGPGVRPPSVDGAPPALRLPGDLVPTRYRASLEIDPASPTFHGTIEIDAELSGATDQLWLHGSGLTIESASAGQVELTAEPGDDVIGLHAAKELPAGALTLRLVYQGKIDRADTYGAFMQESGGVPYVITQMQPLGARRVFPCVDEPWSKVPWQLTIEAPSDQVVLANTKVEREEDAGGGRKRTVFAESKPIPSELVAFAVGRFEMVDAGTTRGGAPIRIAAFQGRTADAAWAAEVTPKIVEVLEDWFGTPYPYDKLDSVPMPAPNGFGAMENPGLVTYKESRLLFADDESEDARRAYVRTAGHELAHQWFGNLVTPAWWDDLWLSEAFATWMEEKVMALFSPAWSLRIPAVADRSDALEADGLLTARTLRQPIAGVDDIETAFDEITYQKGAAVIRMFEAWLGDDVFQAGVQRYLADHSWGTATSDDFVEALDEASPLDVAAALRGYLDQPGAPRVAARLECKVKDQAPPVVVLDQERWLPIGAGAPSGAASRWTIPVCVAYGTVKTRQVTCTVLSEEHAELSLETDRCPRWFMPNADGRGYYRMGLDAGALDDLLDDGWNQLRPHERVLLAGDVRAAVMRGDLPIGAELDLVSRLLRDGSRHAIEVSVDIAYDALAAASDQARPKVAKWIASTYAKRARKLGFLPDDGDGLDRELARDAVVPLAAEIGRESKLLSRAVELSGKWRTLPAQVRHNVLRAAVVKSDDVLAEVRKAATAPADLTETEILFDAMSASDDPAEAATSLAMLLDKSVALDQAVVLLHGLADHPETRAVADAFLREHADELLPRMAESTALGLAGVVTASCDAAARDDAAAWLHARLEPITGGTRVVAQAIEEMDNCIARRAALGPQLDTWLEKRR